MKNALSVWCILIYFFLRCFALEESTDGVQGDNSTEEQLKHLERDPLQKSENNVEPAREIVGSFADKVEENAEEPFAKVVVEAAQNSGVANDVPITSGQPVVVTLSDVAATELHQRAPTPIPTPDTPVTPPTANHTTPIIDLFTNHTLPDTPTPATDTPSKENLTEEIPSFSEWTQKQLQEDQQRNKDTSNTSTQQPASNGNKQTKIWKNYASPDCGAKVVASNPETTNPSGILSPSMGEYNMNLCTKKIWFIVELCEAIQAKKIHLSNAELFSSSPREFVVSVSDRFPTRDWINVGQFEAEDNREVQSFDLNPHLFGKYIKVEITSHYGSQYYCVVSLFRVFGTSEFEVLQKEEQHDDDDDDADDTPSNPQDITKNVFTSATDVVMSMVKKAAEVLGKSNHSNNNTDYLEGKKTPSLAVRLCTTPARIIVCDACGEELFAQVYELLSCRHEYIRTLTNIPFVNKVLTTSDICQQFGFDFNKDICKATAAQDYVKALFPVQFLGAMCNMVAIMKNKVVLNISDSFDNITTNSVLSAVETSVNDVVSVVNKVTDELELKEQNQHTCSTDITYISQIRPTKTLDLEVSVSEAVTVDVTESVIVNTGNEGSGSDVGGVDDSAELEEEVLTLTDDKGGEVTNTTPQPQKESVFLRLSNRIKALEKNMSLSGQYLEELSKRYKKQVEEIQKSLEKTLQAVQEESTKKEALNRQLEEKLLQLSAHVDALIADKNSWSTTITCVIFSSLVTMILVTFCCRIPEPSTVRRVDLKRRKSVDVPAPQPQKKKRRPSDQAMKIVRSTSTETAESSRRRRRKRVVVLQRSNSIGPVWTGSAGVNELVGGIRVEDVPVPLEESEHTSLEPMSMVDDVKEIKLNGSAITVEGKEKKKTLKKFLKKVF